MTARVLLVEDEPSARRYLRTIIETRCPDCMVVGEVENGVEALAAVRAAPPDIVITDIKMSLMDGIDLSCRLRAEFPTLYTIIVSGYAEFDYARRALGSGAVDYLLKPVNGAELAALLEKLRRRLTHDYYARRLAALRAALVGPCGEEAVLTTLLPFKSYFLAAVRLGGLPSRYHAHAGENDMTRALETLSARCEAAGVWLTTGRDSAEVFLLHSPEETKSDVFKEAVLAFAAALPKSYATVYFAHGPIALSDLNDRRILVERAMDAAIVLGASQILYEATSSEGFPESLTAGDAAERLEGFAANGMFDELQAALESLLVSWERERKPYIWVESSLRVLVNLIMKKSPRIIPLGGDDVEFLLEDALRRATSFSDLQEGVADLVSRILGFPSGPPPTDDAPAMLAAIERYVTANYSGPITLQAVCEVFGVSQTYVSRIFRTHRRVSFNSFVTTVRIDAARELIRATPNIPLKDVAGLVGFHDQFYFSRVFKSVVGIPPSEFAIRSTN